MTTYAIGDIQGCNQQALALTERLHSISSDAKLVFVGDLINRGPDSLGTLRHIRSLGERAEVILGNHDLHLLAAAHGIRRPHVTDTFHDILDAPDRDELLDWLRRQPLARFESQHLLVHAGVVPQWTADQTLRLAGEVETALRGPDWVEFLAEMYGNEPARWHDDLRGAERLRCIVNALTRIRFCAEEDGAMEFATKEGAGAALPGHIPWFEVPWRRTRDVTVVFGHWSALGLVMRPNLIGLDTGCVWGGKLTAVRLNDREVIQVDCPQYRRPANSPQ